MEKKLPIGIEDFEELRTQDFYYVDKTGLIRELLNHWGKVNLFTRPRRFGKSLNMSMLRYFFEIGSDPALFDGLAIADETELCAAWQGKYPVLSLTLKDVWGSSFTEAAERLRSALQVEAERMARRLNPLRLGESDRDLLESLKCCGEDPADGLRRLISLLCHYYGRKVILLVDEYDVPLQKAETGGYYEDMVSLISRFFSSSRKTNPDLLFAVVTGCFRFAGESIFTGFNNPRIYTILDERYDEWFGFTDAEVRRMLKDFDRSEYYDQTKEWYDGYRFGRISVYCPWDVINWCDQLRSTSDRCPQNFWANTSGNELVLRFVEMADEITRSELEELSLGHSIDKELHMDLTYRELDASIDNLWSVLFMTGYLTYCGRNEDGTYQLLIPNREIHNLFDRLIRSWFYRTIRDDLAPLYRAFEGGNAEKVEECLQKCMAQSVSFMDGGKGAQEKESFYHGLLLGMLKGSRHWIVRSNREAGEGRADILLIDPEREEGHIIEVKAALRRENLEERAKEALQQIHRRKYDRYFDEFELSRVDHYGIAFYRKSCRVIREGGLMQ